MKGGRPDHWLTLGADLAPESVVFVVQAAYHLGDALAVSSADALADRHIVLIAPAPPSDALKRLRSSWARHRELLTRATALGARVQSVVSAERVVHDAAVLVVRNDWGPTRSLVQRCRDAGAATIGWVEGVQDFDDVDTGRQRQAYRTVEHVFCLGDHDARYFRDGPTFPTAPLVVGSEPLWQRWHGPATSAQVPLVANVNFTYGVLERARRRWVRSVIDAASSADCPLVVSRHPADRGISGRRLETRESIDTLLPRTSRLVSRFSTLVYEALTLGVDVVYYNPHDEGVPTFRDPRGAFAVVTEELDLRQRLSTPPPPPEHVRRRARPFLEKNLMLGLPRPSDRAAAAIAALC